MKTVAGGVSRRAVELSAAVFVAVAALAAAPGIIANEDRATTVSLFSVPEGVSAIRLGGEDLFINREGKRATVFLDDARHMSGEQLWWCPHERIFVSPYHGEQFDPAGRKIGGPARGGLNEYRVRNDRGRLIIDTDDVVVRGLTPRGRPPATLSGARFDLPYNSGPGSFCRQPVASHGTLRSSTTREGSDSSNRRIATH